MSGGPGAALTQPGSQVPVGDQGQVPRTEAITAWNQLTSLSRVHPAAPPGFRVTAGRDPRHCLGQVSDLGDEESEAWGSVTCQPESEPHLRHPLQRAVWVLGG